MTNQDCSHNHDRHSSNADASDVGFLTDDRQSAHEPTSGQWPTRILPNVATAAFPAFPGTAGLSLFTSHHEISESQQAAHYLDLQFPAHSQLPDTHWNCDRGSRSPEDLGDQLNRESLTQPTNALSHEYDPFLLPSSNLEASEPMHRKRRSDQDDLRPEVESSTISMLKKRRLETQTGTGHIQVSDPSQMPIPKTQSILACGLWALSQITEKPTEDIKVKLSCLCGEEDISVMDTIFAASGPTNNDNTISNVVREAGGELWKRMNPDIEPALWHKSMLSQVYGGSVNSWSNWFVRKRSSPANFDDSGHGTMTQTMSNVDREIITRWRCNRYQCCRKKRPHGDLRRDPERKYICTSLCGQTFDSVESWKKHERNNRIQKAYPCDFPNCRGDPASYVWSRKDELEKHLKTRHQDQKDSHRTRFVEIRANVRGNCLWRNCPRLFASFEEFLAHMPEHFNNEWTATDLRDRHEETDAPLALQPGQSDNQDSFLPHSDDEDEGSPSPKAGARPSSGHQASHGYGPGSGNPDSGSRDSAPNSSGGGRSGALGNKYATDSNYGMQLKDPSPSAKQIWQQMGWWSPRLDFLGRLGSGATAVVHEVSIAGASATLACKTFANRWRQELLKELQSMSRLRHPHIVALFNAHFQAGCTSILMLPVADYNLSQYLAKNTFTPTEQCNMWQWFSCLTSGVHHMHEHGVLHHEIEPSNILVTNKQVFYSDFGSSASMADNQTHKFRRRGLSRIYAAPEVFHGDRRLASDIFSLGCVFLEMITVLFFKDMRQQLHGLQDRKNPTSLHWASTWNDRLWALSEHQMQGSKVRNLLHICQEMTNPQPELRPSAAEVDKKLNPRLCRSCSYSTKWPSKRISTWPLDQSSLKSVRGLDITDRNLAKAKGSVSFRTGKLSWPTQTLDQLSLEDASKSGSEKLLSKTGENKTIKEARVDHKIEVVISMMANYLIDQDQWEKFRASGESVLPKAFNVVGLPSQYPTYISM